MGRENLDFDNICILEGMTSISALIGAKESGVNDRKIVEILFDKEKVKKKQREFRFLEHKAKELDFSLTVSDAAAIDALGVGNTHGGVVARCTARTLPLPTAENLPKNAFLCLLDGIEDPYNFGYSLRSLYAAGCDAILTGTRNWFSAAGVVAKASAGASEALPAFCGDSLETIKLAKSLGYTVIAASIRDSISHLEANLKKPILLVVGGEKRGICAAVAETIDQNVRIDYGRSFRGSLSTAAATTVLAFEILRQNKEI